jgi:hypothetical protein
MSTDQHAVYHNKKTKHTVLAMRGTVPTDLRDLKSDKAILQGKEAGETRFKQSLETYDRVKQQYGGEVHVTGHSLGGSLSNHVAKLKGARATTFNAGQSATKSHAKDVEGCRLTLNPPAWCSRIRTHKIGGDVISTLAGGYGDTHIYQSKGLKGSHSMANFIPKMAHQDAGRQADAAGATDQTK